MMGLLQVLAISTCAALGGGIVGIVLASTCAIGKISDLEGNVSFLRCLIHDIWRRRYIEDQHGMTIQLEPELAGFLTRYVKEGQE